MLHACLVKARPLRCKAVGTLGRELVREIAARDEDGAPSERFRGARDAFAEIVMRERGESGDADAHEAELPRMCVQEAEGDHDAVIERSVASPDGTRRDAFGSCLHLDLLGEHRVIVRLDRDLRRAELRKAARRLLARRDVKVVGVHDRVRTRDDHRIWLQRGGLLHCALIGIHGQLYFSLLAFPDLRQDERRMGNGVGCQYGHETPPLDISIMYSLCGAKLLQKWIDSAAAKGYTMRYKKCRFFISHMIYV